MSKETGSQVYIKHDHLQITGSFKERGALNALLSLTKVLPSQPQPPTTTTILQLSSMINNNEQEQKEKGVIAASAGNHALGKKRFSPQQQPAHQLYNRHRGVVSREATRCPGDGGDACHRSFNQGEKLRTARRYRGSLWQQHRRVQRTGSQGKRRKKKKKVDQTIQNNAHRSSERKASRTSTVMTTQPSSQELELWDWRCSSSSKTPV